VSAAGQFRYRVTFLELRKQKDRWGDAETEAWVDVVTVWGSLEALSGRELFSSQQTAEQSNHRIRIRHRAGINPAMRARIGERLFELTSPPLDRDGRRRELELMCREVPTWQQPVSG